MPPGEPDELGAGSGLLFGLALTSDAMAAATSDRSWLRAMLDFEAGLALVQSRAGLVPAEACQAIRECCERGSDFDPAELGRAGRLAGNPAVPLVAALRRALPEEAARWAHFGATSQDTVDTALMLVARQVLDLVSADLASAAAAAAALAERYRSAPMVARTLLQHALPTTFGRKAAGWLCGLLEAAERLGHVRRHRLAVQLGGPAGNLSALGEFGPRVMDELAAELGLGAPLLPWHTDRARVADVAAALLVSTGTAGKIALDVTLLMQDEVGEVFEPPAPGRGASSSMPHKRNPAMAAVVTANWERARGLAAIITGAMAQAHERAAGTWQAEALSLSELSQAAGGAVSVVADMLHGLVVDTERMALNLAHNGQISSAETVAAGARAAEALVERALAAYREELQLG
ncbi:MAG TPA: lyase family protein [Acidimicrobiales bacterium]|nr:lyase family protein [Acidimicrobiales bacterium]